ncbi:hypothetical protein ACFC26_16105 [Kitasatospora purpeofusca]|uniref:hypothetical protein n=1 Tax=Kitasatospora purpeofusca TaxID=67352 RepID=UPI0035D63B2F
MAVRFPNPPLDQIDPSQVATGAAAAHAYGIEPTTIWRWVHEGLVERLPIAGRTHLYYLPALDQAEYYTWQHGADRPARGGRAPGWRPGQRAAA